MLLEEKKRTEFFRELFLYFLVNLLVLTVVVSYSAITSELLLRGESVCSFYKTFHLYCPGCGGSRSLLSLVRFDFLSSFLLFPALIPSVIIFIFFDLLVFFSIIKGRPSIISLFPKKILILIPIIILLNFVIRNFLLVCFDIDYVSEITKKAFL